MRQKAVAKSVRMSLFAVEAALLRESYGPTAPQKALHPIQEFSVLGIHLLSMQHHKRLRTSGTTIVIP